MAATSSERAKTVTIDVNNNETAELRIPLNPDNKTIDEFYDENQKPIGTFLSSILNFNSLIPSNKELNDDKNKKQRVMF
jgi:predicted metal-dependent hydrolase